MKATRAMWMALGAMSVLVAWVLVASWTPATEPRLQSRPSPRQAAPVEAPPPRVDAARAAVPAASGLAPRPAPPATPATVAAAADAAIPAPRTATGDRALATGRGTLDDPSLLAAAREIEDVIITPKRNLDAQRIHDALDPAHFPATLDAFALQSHHDATAMRLGDLLRAQMAVQLGEMNGRLDRLECGRALCAMQFSFREQPDRPFPMTSGISIEQRTPGAYLYRAIFSTDPRVSGIVNTDGRGG